MTGVPIVRDTQALRDLSMDARARGDVLTSILGASYYSESHIKLTHFLNNALVKSFKPGQIIDSAIVRSCVRQTPLNAIYPERRNEIEDWIEDHIVPGVAFGQWSDMGSISLAWGIALTIDVAFASDESELS